MQDPTENIQKDSVAALQQSLVKMTTTMYNAIGIIQRDAAPIPLKENSVKLDPLAGTSLVVILFWIVIVEVKEKLLVELIEESKAFDTHLQELERELEGAEHVHQDVQHVLSLIDQSISQQELSIKTKEERKTLLTLYFDELINNRLNNKDS